MRIRPGATTAILLATVFLLSVPAFAAETTSTVRTIEVGAPPVTPTIEVSGSARVMASPDVAYLSLQVETHAATAEAASSQNAALAHKVVAVLKTKLAGKGRISTSGYSLSPEYAQPEPGRPSQKPKIVGYSAHNSIVVETGNLQIVGTLIDSAIGAGANRVNYLNFGLRNDSKARIEAIAEASKDAQSQAKALASSLGVKLGRIIKATTMPEVRPVPMMKTFGLQAMAATAQTPIQPGQITVSATVSLTYEIQ